MLRSLVRWFTAPSDARAYDAAVAAMRTFDLVYFFSLSRPMNYVIWLFGGKPFTHMGMVVVDPRDGEVYVLESVAHADHTPDVLIQRRQQQQQQRCEEFCTRQAPCGSHTELHNGVRLVSLRTRMLDSSSGAWLVYIQPLHVAETVRGTCAARLAEFMERTDCMHYEQNPSCIAFAPLNAPPGCGESEDMRSFYCSELVAAAYRHCGLSLVHNVSNVWHTAFLDREPGLLLQHGAQLDAGGFYVQAPPVPLPLVHETHPVTERVIPPPPRQRRKRRLRAAAQPSLQQQQQQQQPLLVHAALDEANDTDASPLETPAAAAASSSTLLPPQQWTSPQDAATLLQVALSRGVRIPYSTTAASSSARKK